MKQLSTFQRNNLITGTAIGAELSPLPDGKRVFLTLRAYHIDLASGKYRKVSKYVNGDHDGDKYALRVFAIEERLMDSWDAEDFEVAIGEKDGMRSVEDVENEVSKWLHDVSVLVPIWRCAYF